MKIFALIGVSFLTVNVQGWTLPAVSTRPSLQKMRSSSATTALSMSNTVVVISPPDSGVGQQAAVTSASSGATVHWLLVGDENASSVVKIAPQSNQAIQSAGGSLDLVQCSSSSVLSGDSTLQGLAQQWNSINSLICTYDNNEALDPEVFSSEQAAIRVAAKQVSSLGASNKICILPSNLEMISTTVEVNDNDDDGGILGSNFGSKPSVPETLAQAMQPTLTLRHGELFGIPESSPDFSPLVGGPRRDAQLAPELTFQQTRLDPFVVTLSTKMDTRTSRHSIGDMAAYLATNQVQLKQSGKSFSVSSLTGMEEWDISMWQTEVDRVVAEKADTASLFNFALKVDNQDRLTEWLATKWAPAVLRTYDIAAIRIGARPVYASKTSSETLEIVWQTLDKKTFESKAAGKLEIQVTPDAITATRGASMPLAGEDILMRRLAEACSQAIDKGLAKKVSCSMFVVCL